MFQYDMADTKDHENKSFSEQAFYAFLERVGISKSEMHFSFNGENSYKGKLPRFRAVSWGGYYGADGDWILFIAYRSSSPKHTIQHTWFWDEANECVYNHKIHEFIN